MEYEKTLVNTVKRGRQKASYDKDVIYSAPPQDESEDYATDFWAGTILVRMVYKYPIPDEKLKKGIELPSHVLDFYEKKKADG